MISILKNEVERLRPAHDELAAQMAAFLAAGGEIEEAAPFNYKPKPITYSNQMPPAPKPFVRRRVEADPLSIEPLGARHDRRAEKAEMVKGMASTHTQTEVSAATGMTLRTLRELAQDYGFSFKQATHCGHHGEKWKAESKLREARHVERIKEFKERGFSRRRVCGMLAISNTTLQRILRDYGIDYPKARQGKTSCPA